MKLTRGFLSLVLVLLVSAVASAWAALGSLASLHGALNLVDQDTKRLFVITDVRRSFRSMKVLEREHILEPDASRTDADTQAMRDLRAQLTGKLDAYERIMPPAEQPQMVRLRGAYDRWVRLDDQVLARSVAQRRDEAYALAREHDDDPVSWEAVIASLIAANESRLERQVTASHGTYEAGRSVVWAATALSILFALVSGSAVFRGIRRVLREVLALNTNLEKLVDERTRALRAREEATRQMLDNVSDALFTVDARGRVGAEGSAAAHHLLGASDGEVTLWDYVGRVDPAAAPGLQLGFGEFVDDVMPVEVLRAQMPQRIDVSDRSYSVDYTPLRASGAFAGLLVVARDMTKHIELERANLEQRELAAIVQSIVKDKSGFLEFFSDAHNLVTRLVSGEADAVESARLVHTLKGNTAIVGLLGLAELCHRVEGRVADEDRPLSRADAEEIARAWEQVEVRVQQLLGGAEAGRLEIEDDDYKGILLSIVNGEARQDIVKKILEWKRQPTRLRLGRLAEKVPGLAMRLNKAPVEVIVEDHGLRLPAATWGDFWSSAAHLIRNAVDHGIETIEERMVTGKGPGRVVLRTYVEGDEVVVECQDNGRGIDWDGLRAKAQALGAPSASRADLALLLFADGVSTREEVTDVSGRGVGLAAVQASCRKLGGRIVVESEPSRGTSFQCRFPVSAVSDESEQWALLQAMRASLPSGAPQEHHGPS